MNIGQERSVAARQPSREAGESASDRTIRGGEGGDGLGAEIARGRGRFPVFVVPWVAGAGPARGSSTALEDASGALAAVTARSSSRAAAAEEYGRVVETTEDLFRAAQGARVEVLALVRECAGIVVYVLRVAPISRDRFRRA